MNADYQSLTTAQIDAALILAADYAGGMLDNLMPGFGFTAELLDAVDATRVGAHQMLTYAITGAEHETDYYAEAT